MDLVRLALERAATLRRGTRRHHPDLLARHGQGGSCRATVDDPYDSSFLIVDSTGGWVLETRETSGAAAVHHRHVDLESVQHSGPPGHAAPRRRARDVDPGLGRPGRRRATGRPPARRDPALRRRPAARPGRRVAALRDHGSGP
ncbi:MAG: hypothetical protein R2695_14860 [Acidimicrobiales bacterium]